MDINAKDVADIVAYTVAAASVIVRATPSPKDNQWLSAILSFFKILSLNKK